jgi:hypothetical protein
MIKATKRLLATAAAIGVVANTGYAEAGSSCPGSGGFAQIGLGAVFNKVDIVEKKKAKKEREKGEKDKRNGAVNELLRRYDESVKASAKVGEAIDDAATQLANILYLWFGLSIDDRAGISNVVIPDGVMTQVNDAGGAMVEAAGTVGAYCTRPNRGKYRDLLNRIRTSDPELYARLRPVPARSIHQVVPHIKTWLAARIENGARLEDLRREIELADADHAIDGYVQPIPRAGLTEETARRLEAQFAQVEAAHARRRAIRAAMEQYSRETSDLEFVNAVCTDQNAEPDARRLKPDAAIISALKKELAKPVDQAQPAQKKPDTLDKEDRARSADATGFSAGITIGYRYRNADAVFTPYLEGNYVFGGETKFGAEGANKNSATANVKLLGDAKLGMCVGFMASPSIEVYGGGGICARFTKVKVDRAEDANPVSEDAESQAGIYSSLHAVIGKYNEDGARKPRPDQTEENIDPSDRVIKVSEAPKNNEGPERKAQVTGKTGAKGGTEGKCSIAYAPYATLGVRCGLTEMLFFDVRACYVFASTIGDEEESDLKAELKSTTITCGLGVAF